MSISVFISNTFPFIFFSMTSWFASIRIPEYDVLFFLNVLVATAVVMCRDNNLPLVVFNMNNSGDLVRLMHGETLGTSVANAKL